MVLFKHARESMVDLDGGAIWLSRGRSKGVMNLQMYSPFHLDTWIEGVELRES
jgi:hypothetical protein